MTTREDITGLPITCGSDEALANFNKGIEAYVTLKERPSPWLQAALDVENDIVIAHCLQVSHRLLVAFVSWQTMHVFAGLLPLI